MVGFTPLTPSSAEVKNEWSYISASSMRLHDVDTDNFTFTSLCFVATMKFIFTVSLENYHVRHDHWLRFNDDKSNTQPKECW
jgi:hypothetical protein